MFVCVVSNSPVKTYYTSYYRFATCLLQAYYTILAGLIHTYWVLISFRGFNRFNFTDNFQIDDVPVVMEGTCKCKKVCPNWKWPNLVETR